MSQIMTNLMFSRWHEINVLAKTLTSNSIFAML